jgi:hypothetical protein
MLQPARHVLIKRTHTQQWFADHIQAFDADFLSFEDRSAQLQSIKAQYALAERRDSADAAQRPAEECQLDAPVHHESLIKTEVRESDAYGQFRDGHGKRKRCEGESSQDKASEGAQLHASVQSARERNKSKRQAKALDRQTSGCGPLPAGLLWPQQGIRMLQNC